MKTRREFLKRTAATALALMIVPRVLAMDAVAKAVEQKKAPKPAPTLEPTKPVEPEAPTLQQQIAEMPEPPLATRMREHQKTNPLHQGGNCQLTGGQLQSYCTCTACKAATFRDLYEQQVLKCSLEYQRRLEQMMFQTAPIYTAMTATARSFGGFSSGTTTTTVPFTYATRYADVPRKGGS